MKKIIFIALCAISCIVGFVKGAYDAKYGEKKTIIKELVTTGERFSETVFGGGEETTDNSDEETNEPIKKPPKEKHNISSGEKNDLPKINESGTTSRK